MQASASAGPDVVLGVQKDAATWSTPFDRVFDGTLTRLEAYAHDLLVDGCMSDAGFDDYEVINSVSVPFPETEPHGNEPLFNVANAQKYGYRMAPDPSYKISWENIYLHGADITTTSPSRSASSGRPVRTRSRSSSTVLRRTTPWRWTRTAGTFPLRAS